VIEPSSPKVPLRLILASGSSRRQQLLQQAGYTFDCDPPSIDESTYPRQLSPSEVPLHLARAKAKIVTDRLLIRAKLTDTTDMVVLAADTVIIFAERVIGQPRDAVDARRIIQLLAGTTHIVVSGVLVHQLADGISREARVLSAVRMKLLTPGQVDKYVSSGRWESKAGGYGLQDGELVEHVAGCRTNVIGLPMTTTRRLLSAAGVEASPTA